MLLLQLFESMKMGFVISKLGLVDLGLMIAIIGGTVIGYMRGLNDQVTRFISLCVTVIVTMHFYERIAALITQNSAVPPVFALMVTFFLVAILTNVVAKLIFIVISKLVTVQYIYFLERIVGGIIGAIRFVLLFSFISVFVSLLAHPEVDKLYKEESLSGPALLKICPSVHHRALSFFTAASSGFKK